jgi:type I restriction enzyme S subunit
LGTWDRAIETQQNLIDSLTRRKKALMQQLLTGKTRLPGFEDEWLDVKLGDYFKERRERNHNNLKLLAITAKDGIVDRNSLTKTDTSNADKSKYLRITPGDIGYNTMRMWQGVSGLSTMEGIVSPAYTILKPTEDVHPEFAAYLFKLPSLIFRFKRYSQGLVDDTLSLKYTAFKIIKSSIPTTKEEQQAIAKVLTAADQEIQLHTQHLTSLRTQKRGLMQQFLTGKTRVLITKPASPIN